MAQLWRRWHRQWHSSVVAALRSTHLPVDVLLDRQQPLLSRIYRWIVTCKRQRESSCKERVAPSHVPVLSVGNVTFGATGKTPFVQFLLHYLLKQQETKGRVPLVLSRGYGDDEWRMLHQQFPTCHVALGGDRVAAGAAKVKELGEDTALLSCVVLDDGLQQWRVAKDLEIVMVDALCPLGNGLLLPCGSLRELPRDAFARADVVVLHHATFVEKERVHELMGSVRRLMDPRRRPIVATSHMKVTKLVRVNEVLSSPTSGGDSFEHVGVKRDGRVCVDGRFGLIVCGVGNPESVKRVVEQWARWAHVELRAFPDHHAFSQGDVHDLLERVREIQRFESLVVVTTEKDFARSPVAMQLLAAKVDLRVLHCELELLYNRQQVERRIDSCFSKVAGSHGTPGKIVEACLQTPFAVRCMDLAPPCICPVRRL
ncbi:unnamed protein product [Hyaloperonospora brassicae]|uniref:tetraacyldisaccharide 4'-kinase n=1 Tax=Hyaloperonospora brassicae TaxID=162125 RepID=A0AAV0V2L1_HYABA|nr:unnamed protein product [Hyaloperonospora brassicae]